MPAACQPGEERPGVACLCKARYELLTTSLVSARGRAPAQPACLSPVGPAWLPLGPFRKSQHDSKLPGPGEQGAPASHPKLPSPPPTECANEHTHVLLGPIPVDGQTANSVLYLGFCWEEAKLNNVLIKSRTEWWEQPAEETRRPFHKDEGFSQTKKRLNVTISVCPVTAALAFSPVGNNNVGRTKLIA